MSTSTEQPPAVDEPADPGRPPAAGPVTNLVAALVVLALGIAAVVGSLPLGVGRPAAPGPGTWPALIGVALIACGIGLAVRARRTGDTERFTREALVVPAAVATMVAFVAVVASIGFEIPAALLALVWLRVLGGESWRRSIVLSLAITAAFYLLFVAALDVTVPHLF